MNPKFKMHIPRIDDYLWVAEDGVKMQGYSFFNEMSPTMIFALSRLQWISMLGYIFRSSGDCRVWTGQLLSRVHKESLQVIVVNNIVVSLFDAILKLSPTHAD